MHIVAPSFVRSVRDANLRELWKNSLDVLRRSNEWVVVGYSLPPEDLAIRSLFVRAFQARPGPPRVVVVQTSNAALPRYQPYFDTGVAGQFNYEIFLKPVGLEGFLSKEGF
jgi:hypothetical protein